MRQSVIHKDFSPKRADRGSIDIISEQKITRRIIVSQRSLTEE